MAEKSFKPDFFNFPLKNTIFAEIFAEIDTHAHIYIQHTHTHAHTHTHTHTLTIHTYRLSVPGYFLYLDPSFDQLFIAIISRQGSNQAALLK